MRTILITFLAIFISTLSWAQTPVPGKIRADKWRDVPIWLSRVTDFYESEFFFLQPETRLIETSHHAGNSAFRNKEAVRLRGYITAPTTGVYHFWVSSRQTSDLYLSTDSTKFRKRLIARLDPDVESSDGVSTAAENLWDRFASQMSEPITLEAGESYFFEAYHKSQDSSFQHLSIAWAPPNGDREFLPMSVAHCAK